MIQSASRPATSRQAQPQRRAASSLAARILAITVSVAALALTFAVPEALAERRVVNGVHTQSFPTTGALLDSSRGLSCSGTLIGCHTFLTAAHCVCPGDTTCAPNPADFLVYLQHAGIFTATAVTAHPSYNFGVAADVAVITLGTDVEGIVPTPINETEQPGNGLTGTITGFGITRGSNNDAGIKRTGTVTTASCSASFDPVPEPAHVCWTFSNPLGTPGENSNTCSGDSGGPLFIDFGAGPTVAGITSGGDSSSCLPFDTSFDANVFEDRSFINTVGGADVGATSCGSGSHIGDANTTIFEAASPVASQAERKCRKEINKLNQGYLKGILKARQRCLDDVHSGRKAGPCSTDTVTLAKVAKAAAKVDGDKLSGKCPDSVLGSSSVQGGYCTAGDPTNGTELAACIVTETDSTADTMLADHYANDAPTGPIADSGEVYCQRGIGKAVAKYSLGRLKRLVQCQGKQDQGKIASCPDAQTQSKLDQAATKFTGEIAKACSNAEVGSLDTASGFGGSCAGATTASGLASCLLTETNSDTDALAALLDDKSGKLLEVTVPSGVSRLVITLNAEDTFANDVDLYVKRGSAPTTSDFDQSATTSANFEEIEITSPAADIWYVLVDEAQGSKIAFQATATLFTP